MTEPAPGGTQQGTGAGALLRAAREKQGLHIAALAAAIKVAPRKLDALENDRWDELPDATFTRALAQTVCRTLKIDARPVLDLLPPVASASLEVSGGGLNAPFRDRPGREEPGLAGAAIRPMIAAASLLMVAAVVVYFLPEGLWSRTAAPAVAASGTAIAASAASAAAVSTATAEPASAAGAASVATLAGESVFPPPSTGTPPIVPAVEPVPPPAAVVAPAASAQTVTAASAGPVQLRATQASWVEARDARGQLLLSRVLQPGEALGLEGSLPIRLTIGNAAATQLGFRGQPVDLASSTRDNVARIELR
jgi:cytoskeleton protein RodZ